MLLKLLSLAALACVSAESNNHNLRLHDHNHDHDRSLQAAATCIAMGTPFADCCPCAKPDDGICTLLWCFDLNEFEIHDECNCGQLADACGQIPAGLLGFVDGLTEMCAKTKECCGTTVASNGDFDACIADVAAPDFDKIIPGGIPELSGSPVCADSVSDEATEDNEAPKDTTETLVTEAPADTTETPEVDEATETATGIIDTIIVTLPTVPSKPTTEATAAAGGATEAAADIMVQVPEAPKDTTETPVTDPLKDTTKTLVPEAPADTTETPEVDDTTPDDALSLDDGLNDANKYTVGKLMTLVGYVLSILFV